MIQDKFHKSTLRPDSIQVDKSKSTWINVLKLEVNITFIYSSQMICESVEVENYKYKNVTGFSGFFNKSERFIHKLQFVY